ncbi:GyrI-like domain-containing protein [Actinosynnema sp. NPDC023587]|uniref:GyrI-like domain-containing protein n=1 Tax=Actinosynnema sp. NPDC023587 TaxID=3154695 RepID=UPI0034080F7F
MEIVDGPRIVSKPASHYVGIRVVTPFRGMFAVRDKLMDELHTWLDARDVPHLGLTFFRLHVIDMNGPMDVELGTVTHEALEGDDRVRAGTLPAGRYAALTYVNHARRANRTLLDWVRDNNIRLDRWDEPAGDHFACRYEAYLTDPRSERMKTKWRVELNILLAEESA